jgi:pimeloyl-ACP methyl ester carboxylesterase
METLFIQTQGGAIAYDSRGEGHAVVCVPGMGDLRGEYRFLAEQLASAGYRVITMDIRGHGESSIRWPDYSVAGVGSDIVALLRQLNAGTATIIGTSMAAGAAAWAATEAPELVSSLVLIGPAVHYKPNWQSRLLYGALFSRPWGPGMWIKYYAMLYPTRKPADFEAYRQRLRANLSERGRMEALVQMMLTSQSAAEERLSKVAVPTLILMGSKDPDFKDPQAEAQWVAEQVRGKFYMIEGAGHYPHAEMPEIAGGHILAFLNELAEKSN